MTDDRAVSDVVAYVLIVAIIVISVSLTYTLGLSAITTTQQSEQVQNARRSVVALSNSLNDVQRGDSPARAGELSLSGGTLSVTDAGPFTVTVHTTNSNDVSTVAARHITYSTSGHSVSYVAGGVLVTDPSGSVALKAPPVSCTGRTAVVSLVAVNVNGTSSVSKSGSVLVIARSSRRELRYPKSGGGTPTSVSITVPNHADAWAGAFASRGWARESPTADTFTCQNVDAVTVRQTTVTISFVT